MGVATSCLAEYAFRVPSVSVSWYLLPRDSLRFFDHSEYVRERLVFDRCHPSPPEKATLEKRLRARLVAALAGTFALSALDFRARFGAFAIPAMRRNVLRWNRTVSRRPNASARVKRALQTLSFAIIGFVGLALGVDAIIGATQPVLDPGDAEGVLRTFDDDGTPHETRLVVIDDAGTLWIQSGHHFRGWYERVLRNPDVELIHGGSSAAYRAVPIDTPESETRIREHLERRTGAFRFYLIRSILLFADIKPVRLDPR